MAASSYSERDLSLVPQLNFGDVDKYAASKSVSSGKKHISKGYQYFGEGYVHDVRGKNNFIFTCELKPQPLYLDHR